LEEAGLRGKVKIMVGGAPVTKDFADTIGADGYASNAAAAAEMATKFVS
jgi:5-methyltetrahydrofolate--homocysteine methyltransferase